MDHSELELLDATLRAAVSEAAGRDATRNVDAVVFDLGWADMLATAPRPATASAFRAIGSTGANASLLDDVMLHALGLEPRRDRTVVLPEFGTFVPSARGGLATARAATATHFVVAVGDHSLATVERDRVELRSARGIDPAFGLHRVAVVDAVDRDARSAVCVPWVDAIAAGQRAVAHQTLGACRTMLDLARAHALEREQFGRSIARFQAVRHRLADALVAIETLAATLDVEPDRDEAADRNLLAALAKATAGRTARTVAGHCQQVLAGIGFTTDHAFHEYAKRVLLLDGLLGSSDAIVPMLGRHAIDARRVPDLIDLR